MARPLPPENPLSEAAGALRRGCGRLGNVNDSRGPATARPIVESCLPPLLVSACLLGLRTRFDGNARSFPQVDRLAAQFTLIPVCPEQLGGQPTPRPPAEPRGGAGPAVLAGMASVVNPDGRDVTEAFVRGAREVLTVARVTGAQAAVLKARSPSCGAGVTYDGSFSHTLQNGSGVTAALLEGAGLAIYTEENCHTLVDSLGRNCAHAESMRPGQECAGQGHPPSSQPERQEDRGEER